MFVVCQNCDKKFEVTPGDDLFYQKIKVPRPTRCPRCRIKRRMSFFNQRRLFRKKEDHSGKKIFSGYPSESPVRIYDRDYWLSDAWDPLSYGKDYDFSKSFFEQFRELLKSVPLMAISAGEHVNSDYCNNVDNVKDCYLCFDGNTSENCHYLVGFSDCRDCMDMYQCGESELCYELFSAVKCFQCYFSSELAECNNIWFSRDCYGCQDCFGCANLKNKKYHIYNQPHTKESYESFIKGQQLNSYTSFTEARKKAKKFLASQPQRYMHGAQNDNVVGEYVYHSHNVEFSYQGNEMEDVKYVQCMGRNLRDCYDYTSWGGAELVYESVNSGFGLSGVMFSFNCADSVSDVEYSAMISSSQHLFGCIGLRNRKYCVLNKQYSESDYFTIRKKIVAQMATILYYDRKGKTYTYGEFFPPEMSPINYKQSLAMDFYPLSDEEIESEGYKTGEVGLKAVKSTIDASELPDKISDAPDVIVNEVIGCDSCKRAYRMIPKELEFLKKHNLPIPRLCPDCRYSERIKDRNPLTWWQRTCMKAGCEKQFKTSFDPTVKAIVYCDTCYEGEVG